MAYSFVAGKMYRMPTHFMGFRGSGVRISPSRPIFSPT